MGKLRVRMVWQHARRLVTGPLMLWPSCPDPASVLCSQGLRAQWERWGPGECCGTDGGWALRVLPSFQGLPSSAFSTPSKPRLGAMLASGEPCPRLLVNPRKAGYELGVHIPCDFSKQLHFSEPWFPYLPNGDNNNVTNEKIGKVFGTMPWPVVPKLEWALPWVSGKSGLLGVSNSADPWQALRICISNKFSDDAYVASPRKIV